MKTMLGEMTMFYVTWMQDDDTVILADASLQQDPTFVSRDVPRKHVCPKTASLMKLPRARDTRNTI
jgi:hypothetical protein